MADIPDLNSLSRFRKRAGRLVLEEQGSCEVPAGCGGVVLRWRNPLTAVPITIHLYTPVPAVCFFDGHESHLGQIDLTPGPHAVAFVLGNVDLSAGLILFAAVHKIPPAEPNASPVVTELPTQVLTADDGSWKCNLTEPPSNDWEMLAFDDRDWLVLTKTSAPQLEPNATGSYQCRECLELGAICLGLPDVAGGKTPASWTQRLWGGGRSTASTGRVAAGQVWIRKEFEVPLAKFRDE